LVNVFEGQKTGFFLDQRGNRHTVGQVCKGTTVLNCFAYSGGFSIYAAAAGADKVVSVDISAPANKLCEANFRANGFDVSQHPVITADVFDYLRKTEETFDVIILDPPAFAKSQKDVMAAARGYKDINLQAMKRLKPGGLLATFSCSNHVDKELFSKIVIAAASDAGKEARLLTEMGSGHDHPVLLAHTEGLYLKGLLLSLS
jgi:23S rRNA (cytosine1962-C5)-methyltransferase